MKNLILICCICLTLHGTAQQSAPVSGDAATLIDLLKKDYNSTSPDLREETIINDRARVLAIFKSYMQDNISSSFMTIASDKQEKAPLDSLKELYQKYNHSKQALGYLSKASIALDNQDPGVVSANIVKAEEAVSKAATGYFTKKYAFDENELIKLHEAYKDRNPYLAGVVTKFRNKYWSLQSGGHDFEASYNNHLSIQKSVPFFGGDLAFETAIDGLSRFLAKRIKEELTAYAVQNIRNYLNDTIPNSTRDELIIILPSTTNYLNSFESEQVLNFPNQLKQYIESDLNNILDNAQGLKRTQRVAELIQERPEIGYAFEALELLSQLSNTKNPIDYFEIINNNRSLAAWRNNSDTKFASIAETLNFATMVAYSLTVIENGEQRFASVDFMSNYGSEPEFYMLYYGFLHQQNLKYFKIKFNKELIDFKKLMVVTGDLESKRDLFKSSMIAAVSNAEKIYNSALKIKKSTNNEQGFDFVQVHSFAKEMISFTEEVIKSAEQILRDNSSLFGSNEPAEINLIEKLKPYYRVAYISNDIILDLHQKRFSGAIVKALAIPDVVITTGMAPNPPSKADNTRTRLIYFLNDMALSEDSEDVQKAIEAFALPVGSSSIKEHTNGYYAINAYPGIIGGMEFSNNDTSAAFVGFTAPIGLYLQPWSSGQFGSWGFFIPFIDIGAPVRLRLDNEKDTETLPEFKLSDIFSPGFYISYGFRKAPVAVNMGIQYGPKLRNIPDGAGGFESAESYRLGIGVVLDIPLLTLFNKAK